MCAGVIPWPCRPWWSWIGGGWCAEDILAVGAPSTLSIELGAGPPVGEVPASVGLWVESELHGHYTRGMAQQWDSGQVT